MNKICEHLFLLQDLKYQKFHSRLIPSVQSENVIGVQIPKLRKLAKEICKNDFEKEYVKCFLKDLPHKYYEENTLHAFIIENEKQDLDLLLSNLNDFLPYVDNWATCDSISPKLFKKYPEKTYDFLNQLLYSNEVYKVRFAIVSFLRYFLDDNFKEEISEKLASYKSEEYYINMAISWYFSFALIKQYDATIKYFEEKKLDKWIHNKSLQKAIESFRIDKDKKEYFRTLKYKKNNF